MYVHRYCSIANPGATNVNSAKPRVVPLETGERYNARVPGHVISINPFPLLMVIAGVVVVIFALIARRRM